MTIIVINAQMNAVNSMIIGRVERKLDENHVNLLYLKENQSTSTQEGGEEKKG